jgi:hypothetical protein
MTDLTDKVRVALEVYLQRGRDALAALESQGAEEFFEIMTRRDAAYHNFRALDAQAAHAGVDVAVDGRVKRLWTEIDLVNRTLGGRMTELQTELGERLGRLRAAQVRTKAYHSGTPPTLRLVKQA